MSDRTKKYEGFRSKPYKDSVGKLTIGYGFNMTEPHIAKMIPKEVKAGKRGLSQVEADAIFVPIYTQAKIDAMKYAGPAWNKMDPVQQETLVDMSYQLGGNKLSGFKNMNQAIQKGDFVRASQEALNSNYAKQVPARARDNARRLMLGVRSISQPGVLQ